MAERLGLPAIHLDQYYWRPSWVEPDRATWRRQVEELVAREAWVMDGTYSGTFDLRMPPADAIVYFDLPMVTCLWRVIKRRIQTGRQLRIDMAEGCYERFDFEFYKYVWTFNQKFAPLVERGLKEYAAGKPVYRVRHSREIDGLLERTFPRNQEPRLSAVGF